MITIPPGYSLISVWIIQTKHGNLVKHPVFSRELVFILVINSSLCFFIFSFFRSFRYNFSAHAASVALPLAIIISCSQPLHFSVLFTLPRPQTSAHVDRCRLPSGVVPAHTHTHTHLSCGPAAAPPGRSCTSPTARTEGGRRSDTASAARRCSCRGGKRHTELDQERENSFLQHISRRDGVSDAGETQRKRGFGRQLETNGKAITGFTKTPCVRYVFGFHWYS